MNDDAIFTVVFFNALADGFGVCDKKVDAACGEMIPCSEGALHERENRLYELWRFEFVDVACCIAPKIACWSMTITNVECVWIRDNALCEAADA